MKNHAVIILHKDSKILFVQRSAIKKSLPNIWAFPSGTIEEGEDVKTTIIREAMEELAINVNVEKELGTIELPELNSRLYLVVCNSDFSKEIICDPKEIQKMRWLTFEEFFDEYNDDQIGHGLIYLRKHPEIWKEI